MSTTYLSDHFQAKRNPPFSEGGNIPPGLVVLQDRFVPSPSQQNLQNDETVEILHIPDNHIILGMSCYHTLAVNLTWTLKGTTNPVANIFFSSVTNGQGNSRSWDHSNPHIGADGPDSLTLTLESITGQLPNPPGSDPNAQLLAQFVVTAIAIKAGPNEFG